MKTTAGGDGKQAFIAQQQTTFSHARTHAAHGCAPTVTTLYSNIVTVSRQPLAVGDGEHGAEEQARV